MNKTRKNDYWWYELKLMWNQFDPIGVLGPDSDCPDDEYESYIIPTFKLLEEGATFTLLNQYISYIAKEHIGMYTLSDEYIADFVHKLQVWHKLYKSKNQELKI